MARLARLLDKLYQRLWRLPDCTAGNCYCRRTCECIVAEPDCIDEVAMIERMLGHG